MTHLGRSSPFGDSGTWVFFLSCKSSTSNHAYGESSSKATFDISKLIAGNIVSTPSHGSEIGYMANLTTKEPGK